MPSCVHTLGNSAYVSEIVHRFTLNSLIEELSDLSVSHHCSSSRKYFSEISSIKYFSAKKAPVRVEKKSFFSKFKNWIFRKNRILKVFLSKKLYVLLINLSQTAYFDGLTL